MSPTAFCNCLTCPLTTSLHVTCPNTAALIQLYSKHGSMSWYGSNVLARGSDIAVAPHAWDIVNEHERLYALAFHAAAAAAFQVLASPVPRHWRSVPYT